MEKEQIIQIPLTKIINWIMTVYMVFLGVILPLYHRDGFCMIGDRKYRLFFICSIIVLPVLLLLMGIRQAALREDRRLSVTDIGVLGYACIVIISTIMSEYRAIALWGYEDWHMGAVSQLLFVAIYFTVSRNCKRKNIELIVLLMLVTSTCIFLLGIGNRFAIDPLGMFEGLEYWNKTHLLATIGNINWYSSYACTIFPMGLWYFCLEGYDKKISLQCYTILVFATMITQGSGSGLVTLFVLLGALCIGAVGLSKVSLSHFFKESALLGMTVIALGGFYLLSDKEQIYFASDLQIERLLLQQGWWIFVAIMLIGWFVTIKFPTLKKQIFLLLCLLLCGIFVGGILQGKALELLRFGDSWGSGRGKLWRITMQEFLNLSPLRLLFGVGPDCFAPYIYTKNPQELVGFLSEWWGDAYVANAHNEWLNAFLNLGFLGGFAYVGIFITALYRNLHMAWKIPELQGILGAVSFCILGYMINNSASFQQVVSTPLVFMLLGMGEAVLRNRAGS